MRILVATDAVTPQVNGVVRTYERLAVELRAQGVEMKFLTPDDFRTVTFPAYPEIRLGDPRYAAGPPEDRRNRPGFHSRRDRRPGWLDGAQCLPRGGSPVHHQLPYQIP